jgi:hypothetical protein
VPSDDLTVVALTIEPLVELNPPSDSGAVATAEAELRTTLPTDLRDFLTRSDGATVAARLDSGEIVPRASPLVWSLVEIVERNRSPEPPLAGPWRGRVLFFGDAGVDGILFGNPFEDDGALAGRVVAYNPLEQRIEVVAISFREWLLGWLGGRIAV